MNDDSKTKKQLEDELTELRSQNATLNKSISGSISDELAAEEARRYAENIVEAVREPLLVLDADLKIISANLNFYRIFKVIPGETIGSFIYDLGNKQWDIPKLRELLETILPQKATFDDYEVEHDFATIGRRTMLLNARQIKRVLGKERIILLAIEDITEQKRLENLLMESEERYRRLFETASDGIVLLEKREGKITHANPATEKILGYTKEDSIGNKLQDIGVLLDMCDFQTLMQNLNWSGILNYNDVSIKTKSGKHIDADIYLVDRARLVQCNIRDITDRKHTEEALLESEEKFRTIFDTASDGILVADIINKKFLQGNATICSMLGYTKEEIKSLTSADIHPPQDLSHVLEEFEKQAKGEIIFTENLPVLRKDGSIFYADISSSPTIIGGIHCLIGIFRDITRRKHAEQKLKDTLGSLRRAVNTTIQVMVSAVETRDPYTAGHQTRSADLAWAIAKEMGLSPEKIECIHIAGSIHDIGKLSIPAEILSKPTKLSEIEFLLIKEHAQKGYEILKDIESPWPLAEIVYQHHERMDGSGYPRKLKGEEILLEARVLAVSDVVEAMSSHRPYRPGLGINAALEEIEKNRGIIYDRTVADACLSLFREKGFQFKKT